MAEQQSMAREAFEDWKQQFERAFIFPALEESVFEIFEKGYNAGYRRGLRDGTAGL